MTFNVDFCVQLCVTISHTHVASTMRALFVSCVGKKKTECGGLRDASVEASPFHCTCKKECTFFLFVNEYAVSMHTSPHTHKIYKKTILQPKKSVVLTRFPVPLNRYQPSNGNFPRCFMLAGCQNFILYHMGASEELLCVHTVLF